MPDIRIHDFQGHGRRCFEAVGPMGNIAMIQQHSDPHRTQHYALIISNIRRTRFWGFTKVRELVDDLH